MKVNEGSIDRILRIIVGIGLIGFGYWFQGSVGIGMMIVGLIPLGTGLVGWCPMYSILGFNTCSLKK
ncbi:YgaP family membrane protein [Leptospira noguchii]|uniref:PF11127 family protein n=1 Tax=Leptospira noguchii serovar Autumnalis str. ZUN142 TaxID=1085540 RepID=M6UDK7_9LEPT|nr:DUF2892 domain-containing protein [Leptospira noguchii]EMO28629.1 PF11127 family protein [Leptospira interrogans serovar Bataviae str. HAI135]EKR72104.1 PF11127 family protein [Leptospira noguchii str. 2006001870]EMO42645.1 PF11127 family protein [Leptospira noguchii serovar Autumnalis str. ZUN142]EMS88731.1 PF11127 family protein [Leptospira noguchii str. Hook]UOG43413.1 DUF2892 domain-containing protein [Leptospira noguchii]